MNTFWQQKSWPHIFTVLLLTNVTTEANYRNEFTQKPSGRLMYEKGSILQNLLYDTRVCSHTYITLAETMTSPVKNGGKPLGSSTQAVGPLLRFTTCVPPFPSSISPLSLISCITGSQPQYNPTGRRPRLHITGPRSYPRITGSRPISLLFLSQPGVLNAELNGIYKLLEPANWPQSPLTSTSKPSSNPKCFLVPRTAITLTSESCN